MLLLPLFLHSENRCIAHPFLGVILEFLCSLGHISTHLQVIKLSSEVYLVNMLFVDRCDLHSIMIYFLEYHGGFLTFQGSFQIHLF